MNVNKFTRSKQKFWKFAKKKPVKKKKLSDCCGNQEFRMICVNVNNEIHYLILLFLTISKKEKARLEENVIFEWRNISASVAQIQLLQFSNGIEMHM